MNTDFENNRILLKTYIVNDEYLIDEFSVKENRLIR